MIMHQNDIKSLYLEKCSLYTKEITLAHCPGIVSLDEQETEGLRECGRLSGLSTDITITFASCFQLLYSYGPMVELLISSNIAR